MKVRTTLYGEDLPKIIPGETIVTTKPVTNSDGDVVISNNEDLKVISVDDKFDGKLRYYECVVTFENILGVTVSRTINVIHEESELLLSKLMTNFADVAFSDDYIEQKVRDKARKSYFMLRNYFSSITYPFARTAHKAQGKTYKNVLLLKSDMDQAQFLGEEHKEMLYTSVGRCSETLYVI